MKSLFQVKLYNILDVIQQILSKNSSSKGIIEWFNDGLIIHDIRRLESEILIHYFKHSQYTSFQRQLNIYGFFQRERQTKNCAYFQHEEIQKIKNKQILIKRKQQLKQDLVFLKLTQQDETEILIQHLKVVKEIQLQLLKQFHLSIQIQTQLQKNILKLKQESFIQEYKQFFEKYVNFTRILTSNSLGYLVIRQRNVQRIAYSDLLDEVVTPFLTPKPFYEADNLIHSLFSQMKS